MKKSTQCENSPFSARRREERLQCLEEDTFDLVIIGGGITGAGVARDAASRGMKVALIETQDFSQGTSSRSSKLIHGGIRYLENMEFHLVFEALSERDKLFEMAPHLVHPLRFFIPTFKQGRVPHWEFRLGMILYDMLALFQAPEMHEHLDKKDVLYEFPFIKKMGLQGGFLYSDAYMDDDRLTLETLRSAHNWGALCVNHVKALSYSKESKLIHLQCEDQFKNKKMNIKAKHIISAVGPWTDILGENFFKEHWENIMRPSKGIHLTFLKKDFPINEAIVMGAEHRIVFAIPREDMVIVGTTDTAYKDKPEEVCSDKMDVKYLLNVINEYFPGLSLNIDQIQASYSGIRPLVKDDSQSEGNTSREHIVFQPVKELTCVAGGKYTTYRKMAQDVINKALESFSRGEQIEFKYSFTGQPLNELVTRESLMKCEMYKESWSQQYDMPLNDVEYYIHRYGFETLELLKMSLKYKSFDRSHRKWAAEAEFCIENTMCLRLEDFYFRRTNLYLSTKDHGLPFIKTLSTVFKEKLHLSQLEVDAQVNALHQQIQKEMDWLQ